MSTPVEVRGTRKTDTEIQELFSRIERNLSQIRQQFLALGNDLSQLQDHCDREGDGDEGNGDEGPSAAETENQR